MSTSSDKSCVELTNTSAFNSFTVSLLFSWLSFRGQCDDAQRVGYRVTLGYYCHDTIRPTVRGNVASSHDLISDTVASSVF